MIIKPEEWIKIPDEEGNGLLKAWVGSGCTEFPIPIETHGVSPADAALHREQDFEFLLECAETPKVYPDEESFRAANRRFPLDAEAVVPIGLFSLSDARVMMNGRVTGGCADARAFGFEENDVLYTLSCLGNEYDALLPAALAEGVRIEAGSIVSCVYWVQGAPAEEG